MTFLTRLAASRARIEAQVPPAITGLELIQIGNAEIDYGAGGSGPSPDRSDDCTLPVYPAPKHWRAAA